MNNMSAVSSLERLHNDGGRNAPRKVMATEMQHYPGGKMSSLTTTGMNRFHQRAKSTINRSYPTNTTMQGAAPFASSGPRFAQSPKQFKPENGNPSPVKYNVEIDHFKTAMEKKRGKSFGLGREKMQLIDQERDIRYLK